MLCLTVQPHGLQHARLPCPSPTPGVYLNSCLSCWWCHPTISSSVIPFSFCLQSFPASGSFPMSCSSHQVAKVLEFQLQHRSFQWTEIQGLISFRMDWLDLLAVQGTLKSLLQQFKSINSSALSLLYGPTLNICTWLLERPWPWLYGPLLAQWFLWFLIC